MFVVGRFNFRSGKLFGLPTDLVLTSLVGLLALGLVAGGNVYIQAEWENNPAWNTPPSSPEETFTYDEQELMSIEGWTDEGATSDQALGLLPVNVTGVRAVLTWTDDIGSNDVLMLAISLNGTELASTEGSSGSLELEAGENETMDGELGAQVTAASCPGRIGASPIDLDDGNGWSLMVYVTIRYRE